MAEPKENLRTTLRNNTTYQRIMKLGTPEQIKAMELELEAHGMKWDPIDKKAVPIDTATSEQTKSQVYFKKLFAQNPEQLAELGDISQFVNYSMKREQDPPAADIPIQAVRKYMWNTLRQVIKNQTAIELRAELLDDHTKQILRNICHWMVGSSKGDWDPGKSLYLYGGLGVGKTSIVYAMSIVLDFFRIRMEWNHSYLAFQSMEKLFLDTMSQDELKLISKFSRGGWILDDIKPEMYVINFYGNEVQLVNRILHARHEVWEKFKRQTVITSNTPWEAFCTAEHLNDARLADRLAHQYIPVEFKGKNKRSPAFRLKNQ